MDNENKIMHMLTQIQDGIKQQPAAAASPDVDLEVIAKLDSSFIELDRVMNELRDYQDVTQRAALVAKTILNSKKDVSDDYLRTEYENLIRQCLRGHPAISDF